MQGHDTGHVFACAALVLLGVGPACGGGEYVEQDESEPTVLEQESRGRQEAEGERPSLPLDTRIPFAEAAGEGCTAHESLTILLDGGRSLDPLYRAAVGQPSVALGLTDGDGVSGVLVEDVGDHAPAMNHNLAAWLSRWRIEESTYPRRALLISHPHTVGRMLLPGKSPQPVEEGPAVIDETLRRLGQASLIAANLAELCALAREDGSWPVAPACEHPRHALGAGLEPLVWGDGTVSSRVFLYTYAISPVEVEEVPFKPLETVLIVSAPPGYLVYSVCSHMPMRRDEEHPAPFHVAYEVKALMDAGELEPGPVHTLVTGACGMLRTFELTSDKDDRNMFVAAEFGRLAAKMRDDLGIQRLYLSHCSLVSTSQRALKPLHDTFGDSVRLAYPGACIPLSPPAAGPVDASAAH